MEFNYEGFEDRFDKMAIALGLGTNAGNKVIPALFELNNELGLPTTLGAIDVKEAHIETLATLAEQDFCHPSNPKPVTKSDFAALYRKAL